MEQPEINVFGPPIEPLPAEPSERPLAVALILDISRSSYGNKRVVDLFKSALFKKFSNMEYDNVLVIDGELHEDPGNAVAAIAAYKPTLRKFGTFLTEAVRNLMHIDRFYLRRVVLITDQFAPEDVATVNAAIDKNQMSMSDIQFQVVAFGPQYARGIAGCAWDNFKNVADPSEIETAITEVCS